MLGCFLQLPAFGQPGTLDPTFDPGSGANDEILAVAQQSDGKLIVAGKFTTFNGTNQNRLARLLPNGSLDLSFNIGLGASGPVESVWVLEDDRLMIAGSFFGFDGTPRTRLARLHSDGSLDTNYNANLSTAFSIPTAVATRADGTVFGFWTDSNSFNFWKLKVDGKFDPDYFGVGVGAAGGGAPLDVEAIVASLSPEGKLLVAGDFHARLHGIGTLDGSFPASLTDRGATGLAIQNDGRILLSGAFTNYFGTPRNRIVRLTEDGSIDPTYDPGAGFDASARVVALQPDGKAVVGGAFSNYNGVARARIARLNPDGTLDGTFDPAAGPGGQVNNLLIDQNGAIVIVGAFTNVAGIDRKRVARLRTENASSPAVVMMSSNQNTVVGRNVSLFAWVVGGQPLRYQWRFNDVDIPVATNAILPLKNVQLTNTGTYSLFVSNQLGSQTGTGVVVTVARAPVSEGTVDADMFAGPGVDGIVRAIAVRPNGKILIAGWFKNFNGISRTRLAQLNSDGTLDSNFNPGAGPDDWVYALALQNDGKLLIGGVFSNVNNTPRRGIARLNTDGTLDMTFSVNLSGPGFTRPTANALAVRPDGKILIGGPFSNVNGSIRQGLALVNEFGVLEAMNFNYPLGTIVSSLLADPDGKLVVGFESGNNSLTQYTPFDTPFGTSYSSSSYDGNGPAYGLARLPDGKLLAAGFFDLKPGLAAINTNGVRDTNFDAAHPGLSRSGRAVSANANGRILAGGYFWNPSYAPLVRFQASGLPDINPLAKGPDGAVYAVAWLANGAALVAGEFAAVDGVERHGIVRLNGFVPILSPSRQPGTFTVAVPTDRGKNYRLEFRNNLNALWSPVPSQPGDGNIQMLSDPAATSAERYYRVRVE